MTLPGLSARASRLLFAILILLVIFASRSTMLNQRNLSHDETRSVLRTFGTPAQIIAWQPPDWPPLYNLTLAGWTELVGVHPPFMRYMSVLFFMLSLAFTFRLARLLFKDDRAAWMAATAYGAMGSGVYLSLFMRGYVMTMAFLPAAIYFTLRYFQTKRWRWAVPLGFTLALMFYTTFTVITPFAMIGLLTLLMFPRQIWRWWLPGVIALILVLPEFISKLDSFLAHTDKEFLRIPTLPGMFTEMYPNYVGYWPLVWLALTLLAVALLLWKLRPIRMWLVWLLLYVAFMPSFTYLVFPTFPYFNPRYTWWFFLGGGLLIGGGLAYLPRLLASRGRLSWVPRGMWWAALAFFLITSFSIPIDEIYHFNAVPFESTLPILQERLEPGDVLLVDPECANCGTKEHWRFYMNYYFGSMLPIVDDPTGYQRVWYVRQNGHEDPAVLDSVMQGRLPSTFFGPPDFFFRLYEGPPDPEGVLFENGMRFHGFQILEGNRFMGDPLSWWEGTQGRFRLWWSVDEPLGADYSVGTYLMTQEDEVRMLGSFDGPPQTVHLVPDIYFTREIPTQTSHWVPGQYYVEERLLDLPNISDSISSARNPWLYLTVYQWWDNVRLEAPGVNDEQLLPLTEMRFWAW